MKKLILAFAACFALVVIVEINRINGTIPTIVDPNDPIYEHLYDIKPSSGSVWMWEMGVRDIDTFLSLRMKPRDFDLFRRDFGRSAASAGDVFKDGPWWCSPIMDSRMTAYQFGGRNPRFHITYLYSPKNETLYGRVSTW